MLLVRIYLNGCRKNIHLKRILLVLQLGHMFQLPFLPLVYATE